MACLNLVDWSSLLTSECGIPHDVSFNIVTDENATDKDEATLFHAHKTLLAAVSPVYRTQFYGSLPELSRVIQVKDSTCKAFKLMLEFIYQISDASREIENLTEIGDICDVFYLAHKFEVLGFKEKILARLENLPVNLSNYEELTSALDHYKHFEEACQVVEDSLKKFIIQHPSPLELVEVAKTSSSVTVKEEVINRLSTIAEFNPLEVLKVTHDLISSEGSKSVDLKKVLSSVMEGCIKGYETAMKDPVLFSKFIPSPSDGLDHELIMVQRMWKENFCNNCESAVCKNGEDVDTSTVKLGTHVMGFTGSFWDKGEVSEIGLSTYNKIRTGGNHGSYSRNEGCTAAEHGDWRWNDGIPSEAMRCPGVHKAAKSNVCRFKLENGGTRISCDFATFFFNCK